jgi:DNA (cytosine-5)-methyltransferase 1
MKHGSVFSGGGGFDLAAQWIGWANCFHCEINEFCQKILKYYWPESTTYGDIKTTDFSVWRNKIDILTGGFPCQPYSVTGKRKGTEDDRHLWPEMLRAIREISPRWIVGENVRGIVNWGKGMVFNQVQAEMEAEGYEILPFLLPACSVGADHRRDRVWFIAHSNSQRYKGSQHKNGAEQESLEISIEKPSSYRVKNNVSNVLPEPKVVGRNDGIPIELDGIAFSKWREESTKLFGNAIVPQVAFEIFSAIQEYENLNY